MRLLIGLMIVLLLCGCGDKSVSYRGQIQPILSARCVPCHGPDLARDKIQMESYQALMASKTRSGKQPLVIAGSLEQSRLYVLCSTAQPEFRMPPDSSHKTPLPKEELVLLSRWILQGAKEN
jgi:hypothetical protein